MSSSQHSTKRIKPTLRSNLELLNAVRPIGSQNDSHVGGEVQEVYVQQKDERSCREAVESSPGLVVLIYSNGWP